MKVKDIIRNLHNVNPEADVVMWSSDDSEAMEVYGFAVADNDDHLVTELAICDKKSYEAFKES